VEPAERRGNDGQTRPDGRPHDGLALVSKVRSDDLSPVVRKAEIHDHYLAYGRNLRSDRGPVGVSVPCRGQPRRDRGLLFVGNTRSWGGQNVSAEGPIE